MKRKIKVNNNKTKNKESIKELIKKKGLKNIILRVLLLCLILGASLILIFALFIIIESPSFDKDKLYTKESTVIYDKNGIELARIGSENRELISYDEIPQVFIDALIATEDSRFFQHNGLDIARFAKATFQQLIGRGAGGASTITMQLIKNVYTKGTTRESKLRQFIRKFEDIYMAVFKIENTYTKEEIFEFYVNTLWLGHDGNVNYNGIYGIEQGSQYYFGKSVRDVSLAEASLLVGMYQNPTLYNPYRNPQGCRNRQRLVLQYMVNHGYLTTEEMNAVLEIPIESLLAEKTTGKKTNNYQAVVDYIMSDVEAKTGINPYKSSLTIYSTIDVSVQDVLVKMENGEYWKFPDDYVQEGTAITSVEDGSVVALSGGRNYQAKGLNFATDINRQPGSTAKPIVDYGPYFEFLKGSTGDYLFDEEYQYSNGQKIKNANGQYNGMMTARAALSASRNIPALQVFQKVEQAVGLEKLAEYIHNFGINYGANLFESAAIGGFNGVSPLELSAAYATYARGGYYIEPYAFTKVQYEDGSTFDYKYTKNQVVSAKTSYMITSILMDVVASGASGRINVKGTQVAGKTGSTDVDDTALRNKGIPLGATMDAWSVTYSPEYSIALWYGYETLMKDYYLTLNKGSSARQAIMAGLAKNIYSTNKSFKVPTGLKWVNIEKDTIPLQLPSDGTPEDMILKELFIDGTEPTEISKRYQRLSTPTGGTYSISGNNVTLSWNSVALPDMMYEPYLQEYFNNNYGTFAAQYYEKRITDNANDVGTLGYRIYVKNEETEELNELGWISSTSYTQTIEPTRDYTFVIKASYQILESTNSNELVIKVPKQVDNTPIDIEP